MENFNIIELVDSLSAESTWIVLLIAAIFGMLGGLAHVLVSPPEEKKRYEACIIVGAVSSIAVLFIFDPKNAIKLIALSLIAGYSGKAVLDALGLRVKLALASEKAAEAEERGEEAIEVGKKAQQTASELHQYSQALEKDLILLRKQPIEHIRESMAVPLPDVVRKKPETVLKELEEIESTLSHLEKSLKK